MRLFCDSHSNKAKITSSTLWENLYQGLQIVWPTGCVWPTVFKFLSPITANIKKFGGFT